MLRRQMNPAEKEARRVKKCVGMRKIRQRQRQELQEMKTVVVELEKEYAELCHRAEAVGSDTEPASAQIDEMGEQDHSDLVQLTKKLRSEKLPLRSMLKQKAEWTLQIQRVLDFEASSLAAAQKFQSNVDVQLDTVDEVQAEEELGFHLLTEWDLTRTILDNKRDIRHVESRLNPPSGLVDKRTHRMQAFGWDIIQRVEGSVMEFVFLKKFSNLNVLDIMHKTWTNDYSPSDVSIFRSVFVHFLVEAAKEFSDTDGSALTDTGYVLGTQSIAVDRPSDCIQRDETGRKMAWAELALTTEAYDVESPMTGDRYQQVVWAGRTDYRTKEDAQRNAADTLQGLLRWEMKIVAPVLNLTSL
ncbi:hypothetical protein GN958_ATG03401 [Phytophthora infestans]|uniref:Uncharacterized protein n=1 Tax=Phytophthora infestans TaxID=4787 RepID=A0A8S9V7K1_PHYIN|nr:hypothetical protein GN958_ATG03401 [Phytophthora infestans]